MIPTRPILRSVVFLLAAFLVASCIQDPDSFEVPELDNETENEDPDPWCPDQLRACPVPGQETGVCVDLETDPDHCGECDNSCRTGRCQNGVCQPFECAEDADDHPYGGGAGTRADPYRLCDEEDFYEFASGEPRGHRHFVLTDDLDLSRLHEELDPTTIPSFSGTFDGFGFTVKDLELVVDEPSAGLFGTLTTSAEVSNLVLTGLEVDNESWDDNRRTGTVAGTNRGEIVDVHVEGSVDGHSRVGGLVGVNDGLIRASSSSVDIGAQGARIGGIASTNRHHLREVAFDGTIAVEGGYVGGLVGDNQGLVTAGSVDAAIEVDGDGHDWHGHTGGLVGFSHGDSAIFSSTTSGTIDSTEERTGGLVGYAGPDTRIEDSRCDATVEGRRRGVGGIVGWAAGTELVDVVSEATVIGHANLVGGIAGELENNSVVENAESTAELEIATTDHRLAGGLAGRVRNSSTVRNSSATGRLEVESWTFVGGLAGRVGNDSLIVDSTADVDIEALDDQEPNVGIGGLVGRLDGSQSTISASRATGDIEVGGEESRQIGGLVGRIEDATTIVESSATGDVEGPEVADVGGLVGHLRDESRISGSLATGDVRGAHRVGALVGRVGDDATASDVYATGDADGTETAAGLVAGVVDGRLERCYGIGETDDQLRLVGDEFDDDHVESCYFRTETDDADRGLTTDQFGELDYFEEDWDFDEIWTMPTDDQVDDGDFRRPRLNWEFR